MYRSFLKRTLVREASDGKLVDNQHIASHCSHLLHVRLQQVVDELMCVAQCGAYRGNEDKHGGIVLTRQADSFLQLTAAVHHLNATTGSTAAAAPAGHTGSPQTKKLRVSWMCVLPRPGFLFHIKAEHLVAFLQVGEPAQWYAVAMRHAYQQRCCA